MQQTRDANCYFCKRETKTQIATRLLLSLTGRCAACFDSFAFWRAFKLNATSLNSLLHSWLDNPFSVAFGSQLLRMARKVFVLRTNARVDREANCSFSSKVNSTATSQNLSLKRACKHTIIGITQSFPVCCAARLSARGPRTARATLICGHPKRMTRRELLNSAPVKAIRN